MDKDYVDLNEPIIRGDDKIERVHLRRPKAGELRGVSITDLVRMDVNAVCTVLPRISMPPLTAQEATNLDPFDIGEFAGRISDFFTTPPVKKEAPAEPSQPTSSTARPTSRSASDGGPETSGNSTSSNSSSGGDAPAKS